MSDNKPANTKVPLDKVITIFCSDCNFSYPITLPIEVTVFSQLNGVAKALHNHNHECFKELRIEGS